MKRDVTLISHNLPSRKVNDPSGVSTTYEILGSLSPWQIRGLIRMSHEQRSRSGPRWLGDEVLFMHDKTRMGRVGRARHGTDVSAPARMGK